LAVAALKFAPFLHGFLISFFLSEIQWQGKLRSITDFNNSNHEQH